jgi:hypothetical protein
VRGVSEVIDHMTRHSSADQLPALQGGSHRAGQWTSWTTGSWSPTAMLMAATGVFLAGVASVTKVRRAA